MGSLYALGVVGIVGIIRLVGGRLGLGLRLRREVVTALFAVAAPVVAQTPTTLDDFNGTSIDASRWPNLAAHAERMEKRPSFGPCLEICRKIVNQDVIDLYERVRVGAPVVVSQTGAVV